MDGDDNNDENEVEWPCGIGGEPIKNPKHERSDNHCTKDGNPHLGFQNLNSMMYFGMILSARFWLKFWWGLQFEGVGNGWEFEMDP